MFKGLVAGLTTGAMIEYSFFISSNIHIVAFSIGFTVFIINFLWGDT